MGLKDLFKQNNTTEKAVNVSSVQLLTDENNSYFSWNGNVYQSDIVRSAIRVKSRAIGKAVAKHIRKSEGKLEVYPQPYMKILLEEPNGMMSMQQLLEKLVVQLELNNNAFALIERDDYNFPIGIYPITSTNVEALRNMSGELFLRFTLKNGKRATFAYSNIIHLRQDFNSNEIFGDSNFDSLQPLMDVVVTMDQGIIKTIKNSSAIQWLLKFNNAINPEDLKIATKTFIDSFLNMDTSDTAGAAATDTRFDAQQVTQNPFIPNADQMDRTTKRIYAYFNTNENIIQSKYSENEWISYFESNIEPVVIQLSNEFSRKLFSRKERAFGNKIVFESSQLAFASMGTKLQLVGLVDRGVMSPNEMREAFNMHPVEHGDKYLLRLDTATQTGNETTEETKETEETEETKE